MRSHSFAFPWFNWLLSSSWSSRHLWILQTIQVSLATSERGAENSFMMGVSFLSFFSFHFVSNITSLVLRQWSTYNGGNLCVEWKVSSRSNSLSYTSWNEFSLEFSEHTSLIFTKFKWCAVYFWFIWSQELRVHEVLCYIKCNTWLKVVWLLEFKTSIQISTFGVCPLAHQSELLNSMMCLA